MSGEDEASPLPRPAFDMYPTPRNLFGLFRRAYNNIRNPETAEPDATASSEQSTTPSPLPGTESEEPNAIASSEQPTTLSLLPGTKPEEPDAIASSEQPTTLSSLPGTKPEEPDAVASSGKSTTLSLLPGTKPVEPDATVSSEQSTAPSSLPGTKSEKPDAIASSEKSTTVPVLLDNNSTEHDVTASSEKSTILPVLPDNNSTEHDVTASSEKSTILPVLPNNNSTEHDVTASSEKSTTLPILLDNNSTEHDATLPPQQSKLLSILLTSKFADHDATASSEKLPTLPVLLDNNSTEYDATASSEKSTKNLNVLSGDEARFMAAVQNSASSTEHRKVPIAEPSSETSKTQNQNSASSAEHHKVPIAKPSSETSKTQDQNSASSAEHHKVPIAEPSSETSKTQNLDDANQASPTVEWSSLAYYQKPTNTPTTQVDCNLCYVAPEDAVLEAYLRSVPKITPGHLIGSVLAAEVIGGQCIVDAWSRAVVSTIQTNIVMENIACLGITTLSDLQYHTMHCIRKHAQDLIILGFPGSGKSTGVEMVLIDELVYAVHNDRHAAYVNQREHLKMQRIDMHSGRSEKSSLEGKVAPLLLALVNTHEAMSQSLDRYKQLINRTQLRVGAIYGKTDSDQNLAAAIGCDIIVATPGRVYGLLLQGRISWARIRYVVLDEANKLVGMDRNDNSKMSDLAHHVQGIFEVSPGDLLPPLKGLEHGGEVMRIFMSSKLDNSDWLDQLRPLTRGWDDQARLLKSPIRPPTVTALFVDLHNNGVLRVDAFARFLKERCPGKILAFVHKIVEVKKLRKSLVVARETRQVHVIHSRLGPEQRERTNNNIEREGDCVIIACATIAYGVNLANVNGVATMEPYGEYHEWDSRIGRCGRRGEEGMAYYCYDSSVANERDLMEQHRNFYQVTGGTCKKPERYEV